MKFLKDSNDITEGIETEIWNAFKKAIEKNNFETYRVIKKYVRQILQLSLRHNSITTFSKYIFFPPLIYGLSFEKLKLNTSLKELQQLCAKDAPLHLKEIIWLDLDIFWRNAKGLSDKKIISYFYYWTFTSFGRLFFYLVKNGDIEQLKNALNEFHQISYFGNRYQPLERKKIILEFDNKNGKNNDTIKLLENEIEVFRLPDDYKRHVITGLRYWVFFLYDKGKITEEEAKKLLDLFIIPSTHPKELVNDILFFRSNRASQYMEWDGWDYMERPSGKMYSPPSPYQWMTLGFLADQIRDNRLFINVNELKSEDVALAGSLHDSLRDYANYFQNNFEKWNNILKAPNKLYLKAKCDKILSAFAEIKRKVIGDQEIAIANSPLSQERIYAFKEVTGKAWKRQARIRLLFKHRKNIKVIKSNEIKLKKIGQPTFFEKAKMMFIDGQYNQLIYGTDLMGGQIGRWEDTEFLDRAMHGDFNKVSASNIVETLTLSISELTNRNIKPNLILVSPEFSYKDNQFLQDVRYKPKADLHNEENEMSDFFLGTFDDIPIYTSHSEALNNKIIVSNFEEAFLMLYETNPEWFEQELEVSVHPVSNEEALQRYQSNPSKWANTVDDIILSQDDCITLIKTSVIIDIWSIADFQVLNKEAYVVGYIT
jgi:hypothetical protein